MRKVRALVLLLHQTTGLLHFFASPLTPFDLQLTMELALQELHPRPEVLLTHTDSLQDLVPAASALVLDYTYSPHMSAVLHDKAFTILSLWPDISAGSNSIHYASAFANYIEALNLTKVKLLSDTREVHLQSCGYLITHFPAVFEDQLLQVPEELTREKALEIVGRIIKPSGTTVYALFASSEVAAQLLYAFDEKRLNKQGYAFILTEEAHFLSTFVRETVSLAKHGLLFVTREESWMAATREEAEARVLINLLAKLRDPYNLEEPLQPYLPAFYLVNMQNSQPTLVAVRPRDVSLTTRIVFPGNSTEFPTSGKVSIPVSINSIWLNADGSIYPPSPVVMRGAQLSFEDANNRSDILPNFVVNWKSISLSGFKFNYTFTKSQVEKYSKDLGLLHMPPSLGVNAIQTSHILRDLNMPVPLAIGTRGDLLASPTEFPFYLRTRTGNSYCANVVAQFFKFFKWKRLAVLYTQDKDDNEELYRDFMQYASPLGLNIVNNEEQRVLAPGLSSEEQRAKLNASLSYIMKTDVRILMIISNDVTIIWEFMYDMGIRNEYLLIVSTGLSYSMINGLGDAAAYKRKVVTNGALQFFPRTFVGKEGERVRQLMKAKDKNYMLNGCSYFDCGMLYMHATDYMITSGLDYENTTQVVQAMRGTHFVGCAGVIRIELNSNERADEGYSLINVQYFENNDTLVVQDAVHYNPFSATLVQIVNPIHWPDNSTGIYLDTLSSTFDCPFLESEVRDFPPGVIVGTSVCFALFALTIGVAIVIWRKRWSYPKYQTLDTMQEMSADDVMQLVGMPIECLQYISIGPSPGKLNWWIGTISSTAALEGDVLLNTQGNFYWTLWTAMGTLGVYFLLCMLKLTKLGNRLEWLPIWSFAMLFFNVALPVLSTLLFLPIVSTLSQVFLCFHSTGPEFSLSYLNKDCYEYCWGLKHILHVVWCSVVLCLYIPWAMYRQPLWQEQQSVLHINSQPLSLMVKSVMQVLLLAIDHTLKQHYSEEQGGCFLAVIASYLLFLVLFPQYNYHR